MANLKSLIKVKKHSVEERQKVLSRLYDKDTQLADKKDRLHAKIEKEREAVKALDVSMQSYFGPFADAIKRQISDIDQRRQNLSKQITIARKAVHTAFADMKKVEITDDMRKAEAQSARDKKESDTLDAIGIDAFKRNKSP